MALATAGQANPGGDGGIEVWVDGPDEVQPGTQRSTPDVAMDPAGRTIYVWTVSGVVGGDRNEIFLRRFDASANPIGSAVMVNTFFDDDQLSPRIAVSPDGSFLVIWQSDELDEGDGGVRRWVRGQKFDTNGQPSGDERLISDGSSLMVVDIRADVAALTGGGYVVVWQNGAAGGDDTNRHIRARLVAADGQPSGASFVANSSIGVSEVDPTVTELDDGGFLAAWSADGIWARRFDSSGTAQGDDFEVSTFEEGSKFNPDAARGTDGRVLLVWEDAEGAGNDYEIRGRMYSPTLQSLGNDFRINTLDQDVQRPVRAGSYGSLGFLVAWESDVSIGNDIEPRSIQGRRITGNNQFAGPQFQVNKYTLDGQTDPGVGGMGEGVAVVWRSASFEEEPNDDVIVGQGWYVCGIFCDGFE